MDNRNLFGPHFQRSFLAFVVRDSDFLEKVVRDLRPDIFTDDYAQRMIIAVTDFYDRSKAAPNTLIFQVFDSYLQSGIIKDDVHKICCKFADDLFEIPLQNKSYLLDEFEKFLKHNMFEAKLPEITELVRKADFEKAEEKLKEIFSYRPSMANTLGIEYDANVEARAARRESEDTERFWLLLPHIDNVVQGLRRGEIGVWQSQRSSSGKSAALAFMAKSCILQGKNVLIYTLEMSESAYEDRLDQLVSGLDRDGIKNTDALRLKVQGVLKSGGRLRIKSFPMYVTRCSDLRSHSHMIEAMDGFKPDVVLIDYADLLAPETKELRGDLFATGSEVYSYFKGWMQEERLVGWTAMQSGRDAMKERVADQMHAAGSIAKIQIADVVLSINRTAEEEANSQTTIHVVKAREGRARFDISFPSDFSRMQFWDSKKDDGWQGQIIA